MRLNAPNMSSKSRLYKTASARTLYERYLMGEIDLNTYKAEKAACDEHQDISVPLILSILVRRQLTLSCPQMKPCRGYGQSLHCANFVQPTSSGGSVRYCGA